MADPNCPDCLGEGVNVYSFDPPLAHPCACTFTAEELAEVQRARSEKSRQETEK